MIVKLSDIYWSLRRYIYETMPTQKVFYTSHEPPVPDTDRWMVVRELDMPKLSRVSVQNYRIHCVVKNNEDDTPLQELQTEVVNAFASGTELKYIVVYNKSTGLAIGKMRVQDIKPRPAVAYEGGITSKAIDITLLYEADRHA